MILTIIIPTYNSQDTIIRAIDSCLECIQDIELIIVDDGSKDSTLKVIKGNYGKLLKLKKINIISTMHVGAGNARNTGIANASGRWLMFLDSDDKFKNLSKVLKALKKIEDSSLNIINYSTNYENDLKDESSNVVRARALTKDNLGLKSREKTIWDSGPVYKVFKTNFLKVNNITFPVNVKVGEDLIFNQKCLQTNTKVLLKSDDIYEVIENKNSVTHAIIKQDIINDGIKLVTALQIMKIPTSLEQAFIAKNYISLLVRFIKSDEIKNKIIYSLKKYKQIFLINKPIAIFYNLRSCLGNAISLVGYFVWLKPEILIILLPIMKKIKYRN